MVKTFFTSKTIWFGIAQIVFGVVGYITGWMESAQATTLIFTGIGTLGLRKITSQPIV